MRPAGRSSCLLLLESGQALGPWGERGAGAGQAGGGIWRAPLPPSSSVALCTELLTVAPLPVALTGGGVGDVPKTSGNHLSGAACGPHKCPPSGVARQAAVRPPPYADSRSSRHRLASKRSGGSSRRGRGPLQEGWEQRGGSAGVSVFTVALCCSQRGFKVTLGG